MMWGEGAGGAGWGGGGTDRHLHLQCKSGENRVRARGTPDSHSRTQTNKINARNCKPPDFFVPCRYWWRCNRPIRDEWARSIRSPSLTGEGHPLHLWGKGIRYISVGGGHSLPLWRGRSIHSLSVGRGASSLSLLGDRHPLRLWSGGTSLKRGPISEAGAHVYILSTTHPSTRLVLRLISAFGRQAGRPPPPRQAAQAQPQQPVWIKESNVVVCTVICRNLKLGK